MSETAGQDAPAAGCPANYVLTATRALNTAIELVLRSARASPFVQREFVRQVTAYLAVHSVRVWVDRVKYLLAYPKAVLLRDEEPKAPDGVKFLPTGVVKRWLKPRLKFLNPQNLRLWDSWLQGVKKAALPLPRELIASAYVKHRTSLTQPDAMEWFGVKDAMKDPDFKYLLRKVKRGLLRELHTVMELPKDSPIDDEAWDESLKNFRPSSKACHEWTMSDGGALGYFRALNLQHFGYDYDYFISFNHFYDSRSRCGTFGWPTNINGERGPQIHEKYIWYDTGDFEVNFDSNSLFQVKPYFVQGLKALPEMCSLPLFELRADSIIKKYLGATTFELEAGRALDWENKDVPPVCRVASVLEPLKVRLVSAGPARLYHRARPFQKALHTTLRRMAPFRCIGMELRADMIQDLLPYDRFPLPEGEEFWSLDFSAATDGISGLFGSAIVEYLIGGLPKVAADTVRKAYGLHTIEYPLMKVDPNDEVWDQVSPDDLIDYEDPANKHLLTPQTKQELRMAKKDGKKLFSLRPAQQQTGQLMGSIVSFPILCLINAYNYLRIARKIPRNKGVSTEELLKRVLINGDDVAFVAPKWMRDIAKYQYASCGLHFSQGKCYHHRNYVQLNSKSYLCTSQTPIYVAYLNAGLALGNHKVQRVKDEEATVASCLDIVLQGCPRKLRCEFAANYIERFQKELLLETKVLVDGQPASRNLWLPCSLGGMGLTPPDGFRWTITDHQKKIAKCHLDAMPQGSTFNTQRPLRGYEVSTPSTIMKCFSMMVDPATGVNKYQSNGSIRARTLKNLAGCFFSCEQEVTESPPCNPLVLKTFLHTSPHGANMTAKIGYYGLVGTGRKA